MHLCSIVGIHLHVSTYIYPQIYLNPLRLHVLGFFASMYPSPTARTQWATGHWELQGCGKVRRALLVVPLPIRQPTKGTINQLPAINNKQKPWQSWLIVVNSGQYSVDADRLWPWRSQPINRPKDVDKINCEWRCGNERLQWWVVHVFLCRESWSLPIWILAMCVWQPLSPLQIAISNQYRCFVWYTPIPFIVEDCSGWITSQTNPIVR